MNNGAWPRSKRRANFKAIEHELYTYEAVKREMERLEREINDIASPPAYWPDVGFVRKQVVGLDGKPSEERVYGFVPGRSEGRISDPTPEQAQAVWQYKERVLGSLAYREMARRVEAIEYMLSLLRSSQDPDAKAKLMLVEEKYFKRRLTDQAIADELAVSMSTFYRWRREVIEMIAERLGWVV
ncbi:MAG: hypothetical protein ACM309_09450 [Bacillota bacterium]